MDLSFMGRALLVAGLAVWTVWVQNFKSL